MSLQKLPMPDYIALEGASFFINMQMMAEYEKESQKAADELEQTQKGKE